MAFIKTLFSIVAVTGLVFLAGCVQNPPTDATHKTYDNSEVKLTLDTFTNFPPEIDGCSCYFANDSTEFKKAVYIYMNDYAKISFLKINNVLTKFTQTDFRSINSTTTVSKAKSGGYELVFEVKHLRQSGDETYLNTGRIKVTDQNGRTVEKTVYGECGC